MLKKHDIAASRSCYFEKVLVEWQAFRLVFEDVTDLGRALLIESIPQHSQNVLAVKIICQRGVGVYGNLEYWYSQALCFDLNSNALEPSCRTKADIVPWMHLLTLELRLQYDYRALACFVCLFIYHLAYLFTPVSLLLNGTVQFNLARQPHTRSVIVSMRAIPW